MLTTLRSARWPPQSFLHPTTLPRPASTSSPCLSSPSRTLSFSPRSSVSSSRFAQAPLITDVSPVHGLTIGFFSVGRRVHSRVRSIKRTFTAASGNGEEPGWMSRVKRIRSGEDIVVNRDEGEMSEKKDTGALAMFGAPSWAGETTTGSSGSSTKDEKLFRTDSRRDLDEERKRENDDHPPKDILADLPDHPRTSQESRRTAPKESGSRDATIADEETTIGSAKEANYSERGDTTAWKEGRHVRCSLLLSLEFFD